MAIKTLKRIDIIRHVDFRENVLPTRLPFSIDFQAHQGYNRIAEAVI